MEWTTLIIAALVSLWIVEYVRRRDYQERARMYRETSDLWRSWYEVLRRGRD